MNVQEYIESGSIESCVLQLASVREQRELERLCAEFPEIQAARDSFESKLEKQALAGAVAPAPFIRDVVLSVAHDTSNPVLQKSHVITGPEKFTGKGRFSWNRLVIAASMLLLVGSAALNIYLYNNYTTFKNQYSKLLAEQQELVNSNKAMQANLNLVEKDMAMMKDPNMLLVKMADMNNSKSMVTVYWDSKSKDVYLLVNQLPVPQAGQQYQLWAMVDGIPVDAGMVVLEHGKGLHRMKNIPKAEAFAITLEKAGGSPTPTMTALYVMGKV